MNQSPCRKAGASCKEFYESSGMIFLLYIFSLSTSFLLVFYLIPLMIKAAYRIGFLDYPDGQIKKHKTVVPYLGGVAVYVAFMVTLGFFYPFKKQILWLLLGSTLLLFVGLIDDFKVLKPYQKFAGQIVAVLFFLKGGWPLHPLFFLSYLKIAAATFWMLLVINAFNLVDVMDGLSSILAIIAALSFSCVGFYTQNHALSLLMMSFIGALTGFFVYNKPPARIYLGDAGSLFVGGVLAASTFFVSWSSMQLEGYFAPLMILAVPLLILAIPLFEISSLIVIRTFKGIPFYQGSPHHFAIYLQKKKWSVKNILWFTGSASLLSSMIALLFLFRYLSFFNVVLFVSILLLIWIYCIFFKKNTVQR